MEQFALGMESFTPKLSNITKAMDSIKNATSLKGVNDSLYTGMTYADRLGVDKLNNPLSKATVNNKTVNINAPLISVQSVQIKDQTDAKIWAKESASVLQVAARGLGG
jgi:hypothetical protein